MATARGTYSKKKTHKKLLPYGTTKKRGTTVTKKKKVKAPKSPFEVFHRKVAGRLMKKALKKYKKK